MPYLFDTNIFLEILLDQNKKDKSKKIISENIDKLFISDFSIHSIGVILIKQKKFQIFNNFLSDIIPHATILSLSKDKYSELNLFAEKYSLDFDDSYQIVIARENNLDILTMDKDFKKIKDEINIKFL
jgi:predicted nucleic acid-binding protein